MFHWHNHTQHNNTQHNDLQQHNGLIHDTRHTQQSAWMKQHNNTTYAEFHYADDCCILFVAMLSVMLSVIMHSVVLTNVIVLNAILLSVIILCVMVLFHLPTASK